MSQFRILLVEPNPELARVLGEYFERCGLEIIDAKDAQQVCETNAWSSWHPAIYINMV